MKTTTPFPTPVTSTSTTSEPLIIKCHSMLNGAWPSDEILLYADNSYIYKECIYFADGEAHSGLPELTHSMYDFLGWSLKPYDNSFTVNNDTILDTVPDNLYAYWRIPS